MYTHNLDPILVDFGFVVIRWYSLAYIFGILIGWYLAKQYFVSENIKNQFDDYLTYVIIGLIIGIVLGLIRNFLNKAEIDDRKKIRRSKNFLRKKSIDFLMDKRVSGIFSIMLLVGMPFYLSHQSKTPIYFGMYSAKMLIINIAYILIFFVSTLAFIYSFKKKLDD